MSFQSPWREEFERVAKVRREDIVYKEKTVLFDLRQRERREEQAEARKERDETAVTAIVLASSQEMADFIVKVDAYDTATVEALTENEEQLRGVREELKILLDKAYVLPDGRRVFKTEDGSHIFDEHGAQVKDVEPDAIEDWRPRWEKYEDPFERETGLSNQRTKILEFQKLSDEIHAETKDAKENGGMSRARLKELEEKLAEEAPETVKAHMKKKEPEKDAELLAAPKPEAAFRPAGKLDMPVL